MNKSCANQEGDKSGAFPWTEVKYRAVNFSASVTLTSCDLFALQLTASCISLDREDKSCPSPSPPTPPLTGHITRRYHLHVHSLWTWPTSPSPTTATIILSAPADRLWHPPMWAEQLIKAFIRDRWRQLFLQQQQIDACEITQMRAVGCLWGTDHGRCRKLWRTVADKLVSVERLREKRNTLWAPSWWLVFSYRALVLNSLTDTEFVSWWTLLKSVRCHNLLHRQR